MRDEHRVWIEENAGDARGLCAELTTAMNEAFPSLRRVRGHYECPIEGARPHWWLIAEDGEIVDPTASQFVCPAAGEYLEHDESGPEPTGRCLACGGYAYGHRSSCSDACLSELERAYGFARRKALDAAAPDVRK